MQADQYRQQDREDRTLDSLAYASKVGSNKEKKCLDGTRSEILSEVVDWITNTDLLCSLSFGLMDLEAGKGKFAIAHTIAHHARNLGLLGPCFYFTRVKLAEGLHTKLFLTIARDLADRALRLRAPLTDVITKNRSLMDTEDVAEQWENFIVEFLSRLRGFSTGVIVEVIDALDESGAEATRAPVLEALIASDAKLPANIRILLTSRPLVDIWEALNASQHVFIRSLDDIDTESTTRDIVM